MKPLFVIILLLFACLLQGCAPKSKVSAETKALSQTAHQLILPWHSQFAQQTRSLHEHLERFCQNPGNKGELDASRNSWTRTMLSWQQLSIINFGPITEGNLAWRIQFWPDSHNRVGRKVDQIIAGDEPITANRLSEGVVLVQGLSALEYLLFDPVKSNLETFQNPRACEFLLAAGENTRNVALALYQRWQPEGDNFLATFLSGGPNNPMFPSDLQAVGAIVSAMASTLEIIKNKKIADAFGGEPVTNKINPYKLELWRSGASLQAMKAQINSIQELFEVAIKPLLLEAEQGDLARSVNESLKSISSQLGTHKPPLFETIRQPGAANAWQATWTELSRPLGLLKREVPATLNIQIGFNSNDGD